jgi:hypothetical protein
MLRVVVRLHSAAAEAAQICIEHALIVIWMLEVLKK